MKIQNVVIAGGGVLGSQIAYQCSYAGFHVTTYLRSEASVERARPKVARLHGIYTAELQAAKAGATPVSRGLVMNQDPAGADFDKLLQKADAAYEGFHYETDLAAAVADADLVIEALAEQPEAKEAFFSQLSPLLPEKTIIATNSSTLLPSLLAKSTGRPAKFLALHFANNIWKQNIAEVMGHSGTAPEAYEAVAQFAADMGMIPMRLKKERAGYILNSMLVPFLMSAQTLLADGIADVETIDQTWMLATGAPFGPFRILDIVGITTAYNIIMNYPDAKDPTTLHGKLAKLLKEDYLDQGKTGINAGEGFYRY